MSGTLNKRIWGETVETSKLEKKHNKRMKKHYVLMRKKIKLKKRIEIDKFTLLCHANH